MDDHYIQNSKKVEPNLLEIPWRRKTWSPDLNEDFSYGQNYSKTNTSQSMETIHKVKGKLGEGRFKLHT